MNTQTSSSSRDAILVEMAETCVITRARLISRVLTSVYDEAYRPHGVGAAQLILLTIIERIGPASRADIGRFNQQDRSTLTRNIDLLLAKGWIEEVAHDGKGRARPLGITTSGRELLLETAPAWKAAQEQATKLLGTGAVAGIMRAGDSLIDT